MHMAMNAKYCTSFTEYSRYNTSQVNIGLTPLGGNNPIRLQSMTNTDTNDIDSTVEQCIRIIDAGADYVRITAQGVKEAENLKLIKQKLREKGYDNPLVADIHFTPKAALIAAQHVEKVRINPGNYTDKRNLDKLEFSDVEYNAELEKIKENLRPLLDICKKHNTAIRIGVNHGSLSSRIMSKYGDTPMGMVMSMLEFLRICKQENFNNVVLSLKASNTRIMVQSCRLLMQKMQEESMNYPIHLGVTEAGDGEDGRIKSAVGIGALLLDGIGDTIRVSLTEAPEAEIPVARQIVNYCTAKAGHEAIMIDDICRINPYDYSPRKTRRIHNIGGDAAPVTIVDINNFQTGSLKPDYIITPQHFSSLDPSIGQIIPISAWKNDKNTFPLYSIKEFRKIQEKPDFLFFLQLNTTELLFEIDLIREYDNIVLIAKSENINISADIRAHIFEYINQNISTPIIMYMEYNESDLHSLQIKSACDAGYLCIDGLINGLFLSNKGTIPGKNVINTSFSILQASRLRFSKTEYISCPSCGRTLFDIQDTLKVIKEKTGHLKELKIGVMGCIVNGPGEMADADYGYVGAGKDKITLYKKKKVVSKNIPANKAVDQLIQLIKDNGDWVEQ